MDADDYQALALRSAKLDRPKDTQIINAVMGLAGESGEVIDHVKKACFHDHPLDATKVKEELGDILWYVALACHGLDCTISSLMVGNIEKLRQRYPDGFSAEASINREE